MYRRSYLLSDIYWCFIPLYCRDCSFLEQCRKGFFKGRKCYNGCIKAKFARKMKYEEDRQDYLDNLVKYVEEQERKKNVRP